MALSGQWPTNYTEESNVRVEAQSGTVIEEQSTGSQLKHQERS